MFTYIISFKVSRHNTESRAHFISKTIKGLSPLSENVVPQQQT